jgi:hypothetical protein
MAENIFSYGRRDIIEHFAGYFLKGFSRKIDWHSRKVLEPGFVNATLCSNDKSVVDAAEYQLDYYRSIIDKIAKDPGRAKQRMEDLVGLLRHCRETGWQVIVVRFPIGKRMLAVEEGLPEELGFEAFSRRIFVNAYDYRMDTRVAALPTIDESHLSPESAVAFSSVLADDFARNSFFPALR